MLKKFFYLIPLFLVVLLTSYLVIAESGNLAPLYVGNGTNVSMLWFNVSNTSNLDNNLTSITINNTGNATLLNITGVTVWNSTSSFSNFSFGPSFPPMGVVVSIGTISGNTNFTINFSISPNATNGATIKANITNVISDQNITFNPIIGGDGYNSTLVIIDSQGPLMNYGFGTLGDGTNNTGNLTINVSATDLLGLSNIVIYVNNNSVKTCSSSPCFYTNNSVDGKNYVFYAVANDTNNVQTNLTSRKVTIDNTKPIATATCSPSRVSIGSNFPCSCSGSDATSGVNTTNHNSTSPDGVSTPTQTGNFVYTCIVKDFAGNVEIDKKNYSVSSVTNNTNPSTTSSTNQNTTNTTLINQTRLFTRITPGVATVFSDFDLNIGIKQMEITVKNETQNVKITVIRYDSKPPEVLVSKSGKVYQYLKINATNLSEQLDKVKIQFRVERAWVDNNSIKKQNIIISKFNETDNEWKELNTNYTSEDSDYYYYEVVLDSFSYFAISEKVLDVSEKTQSKNKILILIPIVILLILLILGVLWFIRKKKISNL